MIISTLKSVHSGLKKAKRDYAKVTAFYAEHAARHDADPEFQCGEFAADFWAHLGKDVNPHLDIFEAAGYTHGKNRLTYKHRKNKDKGDGPSIMFGGVIEMNGDETREDLIEKVRQAMRDKREFDELVSETDFAKPGPFAGLKSLFTSKKEGGN